jgi:hypothetical protein
MASEFQVVGRNDHALFSLRVHRGDGMSLLGMNWKDGTPSDDFVGFAIEYREPGGNKFYALNNRLCFPRDPGDPAPPTRSTKESPIQKFRWVHFPRNAELAGDFTYRITPVFMDDNDKLTYGEPQEAQIQLCRETYPDQLNVSFTRGFVSSQAFVDRYAVGDSIASLIPASADEGLDFVPTHPKAEEALSWMGFEARNAILQVLDQAIEDESAEVSVVAYDLCEPGIVSRLEKLGDRLRIIIDDSAAHGKDTSGETQAAERLVLSAGHSHVKRQHMLSLQHNKTIVVNGDEVKKVVCGSTNFSWRGFFVQSNNAVVLSGEKVVKPFLSAFEQYWSNPTKFKKSSSAEWCNLDLDNIDAKVAFSPHGSANALLETIADDVSENTTSSLFYSLAFIYQTRGAIPKAIKKVSSDDDIFVYGISDHRAGGLELLKPDGNVSPVYSSALTENIPEPFRSEPTGGGGVRMHHKFIVIDFDKPTARVYLGSYNFSSPADLKNGENLLLIQDRRIAVSYMVEALRIFDHYHFRVMQLEADEAQRSLSLMKPPREAGDKPWWEVHYSDKRKSRDREIFA